MSTPAATKAEELRLQGNEAFKAKDFKKSLDLYSQAAKLIDSEVIFSNKCAALVNMGKFEDALSEIRKALVIKSDWPKLYIRKAQILKHFQAFRQAKQALEKCMKICAGTIEDGEKQQIAQSIAELNELIEKRSKNKATDLVEGKTNETKHYKDDDDDEFIPEQERGNTRVQNMYNQMQEQFMKPSPMEKKHKPVADRMQNKLKDDFEFVKKHVFGKTFTIRLKLRYITPEIYRIIKVPATIKLDVLHDKVIAPCLGWLRNYHAFFFQQLPRPLVSQDKSDNHRYDYGAAFGPEYSEAVDFTCHRNTNGLWLMDASLVSLGQILMNENDRLLYVYDYGDFFEHEIILEKIENVENLNEDEIILVSGEMACPPEDGKGNWTYADILSTLDLKKGSKYREKVNECQNSANYGMREFIPFVPYEFDLDRAQKALFKALNTKTSPGDLTNMMNMKNVDLSDVKTQRLINKKK